jgi:hypothetical protein
MIITERRRRDVKEDEGKEDIGDGEMVRAPSGTAFTPYQVVAVAAGPDQAAAPRSLFLDHDALRW